MQQAVIDPGGGACVLHEEKWELWGGGAVEA